MKVVIYRHDDILNALNALNRIQISGVEQAKFIVYIANILEGGETKNRHEPAKEGESE